MKRRLFKLMWVVVIFGVLLSPACKKSKSSEYSQLYHTWEWVQTSGGIAGVHYTPESVGYTESIDFQENGTYTVYRNDLVFKSGTYTVYRAQSYLYQQEYDILKFADELEPIVIFSISDSELILQGDCWDCYGYIYRR